MNLLLLRDFDRLDERQYRIAGSRLAHLIHVLKLSVGDSLEVGLLNGPAGIGQVISISDTEAIIEISSFRSKPEVPLDIDLILAIPRPKTLRKVLVTCGMMGVRSLHLVRANRTEKSYLLSPILQPSEYEPYLLDGLSQGKLTRLPEVHIHPLFRPFVEDIVPTLPSYRAGTRLLCDLMPAGRLDQVVSGKIVGEVMLAVGPEGGWVPFERELLQKVGFVPFNLGPWVLRVETAVAVALGQIEVIRHQRESGEEH